MSGWLVISRSVVGKKFACCSFIRGTLNLYQSLVLLNDSLSMPQPLSCTLSFGQVPGTQLNCAGIPDAFRSTVVTVIFRLPLPLCYQDQGFGIGMAVKSVPSEPLWRWLFIKPGRYQKSFQCCSKKVGPALGRKMFRSVVLHIREPVPCSMIPCAGASGVEHRRYRPDR